MSLWMEAGLWGLFGGSALIIGAVLAYLVDLPRHVVAGIMAFGCGVLISAVAYDLLLESYRQASFRPVVIGALAGSATYAAANWLVSRAGKAHHRKRSGDQQAHAGENNGLAIAIGSLLDGISKSVVLGASLVGGNGVSVATRHGRC